MFNEIVMSIWSNSSFRDAYHVVFLLLSMADFFAVFIKFSSGQLKCLHFFNLKTMKKAVVCLCEYKL